MSTKGRIRRTLDFGRLREALAAPGIDGRTWVCLARVDDVPDAIYWLDGSGWIVDVTVSTGQLAGEGPIPCRVASAFGGAGEGTTCPIRAGAEVVVVWADGDPTVGPVVMGVLWNPGDQPPPATVNGQAVQSPLVGTAHTVVTPADVQIQVGDVLRVEAQQQATLGAPQVRLADDTATQPFVRGTDYQTAMAANLANALNAYATAMIPPGPPITPVTSLQATAAATALATALGAFATAISVSLSTRITGE